MTLRGDYELNDETILNILDELQNNSDLENSMLQASRYRAILLLHLKILKVN